MELHEAVAWAMRGALVVLLAAACVGDTRSRRIPNWVGAAGLIAALLWHGVAPAGGGLFAADGAGGLGLASSATGAVLVFALFLVMYRLRVLGAGDVKLAAMLGAWFGIGAAPLLVLSVFVCGGVLALARLAGGVSSRKVASNLRLILSGQGLDSSGGAACGPESDAGARARTADRMPYAWAIATGAAALAVRQYAG
ncbi:MAG: prepilin peptidase [Burkholderiaceae bacterium]|nr:prepilin peptidase [Burkholderiaceae bacterium]